MNDPSTDAARRAECIAQSRAAVAAAAPDVSPLLPDDWRVAAYQNLPGATITLAITPADPVDVTAYLFPPPPGHRGWTVRVNNRAERVDYPLYARGGAEVAHYDTVTDAVRAAITALQIDIGRAQHRASRPR